jgi:hypothetical protein
VNDTQNAEMTPPRKSNKRWWQSRWWQALAGIAVLGVAGCVIAIQYVERHAAPILRKRIIESVSKRFNSPVELDRVEISAMKGLQVTGEGLRVQYVAGAVEPGNPGDTQPMLSVRRFEFRTDVRSLFHASSSIGIVYVQGMELHIPPAENRGPLVPKQHLSAKQTRIPLLLSHIICDDAKLFIETSKPGKEPLEFDISHVELTDIGVDKPFHYEAMLTNPKPTGLIHAVGSFGPWHGDQPRNTPIDGDYDFNHADLSTIKGIGGMLASTGHFSGLLGRIIVDGVTDTPDFFIDTGNHPMPLHTQFHAIVDGTTGDTTLDPVEARLLHSQFTARGTIMKVPGKGHDIALDVDMPSARIEDMLQLAVKTVPPLMRGALTMHTQLHIAPGPERVAEKIELGGKFDIRTVTFTSAKTQDEIDSMSMRAQGKPEEAHDAGSDHQAEVSSEMKADFTVAHGMTTVHNLNYQIPGALVLLDGVYSLNGEVFEFKGHVRTEATASQMTTGWKSLLLKAVDPFLKKDGAGLEIPISISGTKSEPHFGLALHDANETTDQMKQDLKDKVPAKAGKKDRKDKHAQPDTSSGQP